MESKKEGSKELLKVPPLLKHIVHVLLTLIKFGAFIIKKSTIRSIVEAQVLH